ncbi:MAG: gliding motility-associated C-terminal domain-containing protein, partial [Chitinophagaceae bacterium]|nr:gliding motility-associated C-terminal domain-containing protein [Chitinophagaceae bacterium]
AYPTSPTKRIQYTVVGTAPYRKWILSFYKVPLFGSLCKDLIENTQQIVLYESLGLVEVLIFSKQICPGWNQGRAMIGLQSFDRTQGIMAPNRKASDDPWGSIDMNEGWRFVPAEGASLLKRVELYDLSGNLISTGGTTDLNNGTLQASFPNVNTPVGTTSFVVKSIYQKIDDAATEVVGMDTVQVIKNPTNLSATTTTQPTLCGSPTGSISVDVPPGSGAAPYEYSLNEGSFQTNKVFSGLSQGNYVVTVRDAIGCTYTTNTDVDLQNDLILQTMNDTAVCQGSSFIAKTNSNGANFNWSPTAGVDTVTAASPTITSQLSTNYIVTATLGSCTASDTLAVSVLPLPEVDAGQEQTIIAGDAIQLKASASKGIYSWSPAADLNASNILDPTAKPSITTSYTLTVINEYGCTANDDVAINVIPYCVKPMEAFTPNGDGINDVWKINNGSCIRTAKAQVFNRYGSLVYESNDYKNNWDGTYKGKPLPDGTYYFILSYQLINGKAVLLRGSVSILR